MKKNKFVIDNFKRNFIWNTIGCGLNSIVSLFFMIIITRINGLEIAGVFSYIFTLSLILFTISNFGGRIYQISESKLEFSNNEYFSSRLISTFFVLALLVVIIIISNFNLYESLMLILLVLVKIFETFSEIIYGIFQKENRLYLAGISLTIKILLGIFAFLVLNIFIHNLIISLLSYLIIHVTVYYTYDRKFVKKYTNLKFKLNKRAMDVLRVTKYIFLFNLIIIIIANVPRFMVNQLLNKNEQGYFGIIIMIPTVMLLMGQFIIQPIVTNLTELYNNKQYDKFIKMNKKIYLILFLIACVCSFFAYILGPLVLNILYGINFEKYRLILVMAIIGGLFNVFTSFVSVNLTIYRKTKIQFILYLIVLVLSLPIYYLLSKKFRLQGIFISYVLITFIQFTLFYLSNLILLYIERRNNEKNITYIT